MISSSSVEFPSPVAQYSKELHVGYAVRMHFVSVAAADVVSDSAYH